MHDEHRCRRAFAQHASRMPDEIGGIILFLASPAARYVTGTTVVVDGGYLVG